jgi:excisionase family DNA binding protein
VEVSVAEQKEEAAPKAQLSRSDLIRHLEEAGLRVGGSAALDEPLLTTSQVAAILRTTPRTVRNWADGGKIGTIRSLGGRRLFPASAVVAALETMIGSLSSEGPKS